MWTAEFEKEARDRMKARDEDDWPVLAVALKMRAEGVDVAIWSQDRDFDGCGIAVWTTGQILDQVREIDERQ